MRRPYALHALHLAPAAPGRGLFAVILALVLVDLAYGFTPTLLQLLVPGGDMPRGYWTGSTPWGMILGLASFGVTGAALALVVRHGFGRPFVSLLGDRSHILPDGLAVAKGVSIILLAVFAMDILTAMIFAEQVRPFGAWAMFAIVAMPAIFVQTSTEELIYRGFLQQQLGQMSSSPLAWMVLPSLLFGLSHIGYSSDFVENAHYVAWTFCFGLICADLTARTGSLGPALAVHFVYNCFAFLLIGWDNGPNSGLALFLYPLDLLGDSGEVMEVDFIPDDAGLGVLVVTLLWQYLPILILWLAARVALRR